GLDAVIMACLAPDRNKRIATIAELAERVAPFAADGGGISGHEIIPALAREPGGHASITTGVVSRDAAPVQPTARRAWSIVAGTAVAARRGVVAGAAFGHS